MANDLLPLIFGDASPLLELGLPLLDPLNLPILQIPPGKGLTQIQQVLKNIKITGLSKLTIEDLDLDLKDGLALKLKIKVPRIDLSANYDLQGKILIIPVYGKGSLKLALEAPTIEAVVKISLTDAKEFSKCDGLQLSINPRQAAYQIDGLFGGDPILGAAFNKIFNLLNLPVFFEFVPQYELVLEKLIVGLLGTLLKALPALTEILEIIL